jgi:integrase
VNRRNSNGQGTIYRRKDGRWQGQVYLPTVGGIRKRFSFYGLTRADVHSQLVAQQAKVQQGRLLPDRSWSLEDYLDYWLANVVQINRRPKTYESYEAAVRLYLKPNLGRTSLQRLTVAQLQTYLNQVMMRGGSIRTVHLIRTVLSAALTRAMREQLVDRNVARLVELPAWRRKDFTPWTAEQIQTFLAAAKSDPLYVAFLLIALYGLRRGEVLGLRWIDIDFSGMQLRIRQQIQAVKGGLLIGEVKTEAGKRELALLPAADQMLTEHAEIMRRQESADQRKASPDGLVFSTRTGHPINPHNFLRSFNRVRIVGGLPPSTLHHLRHATATLLKNTGVPARDAQLILGHADITTTQQLYQHADLAGQLEALSRVQRLVMGTTSGRRCRQLLPSGSGVGLHRSHWISGGPSETRTHDTLLKRSPGPPRPADLAEAKLVHRRRYRTSLLGAAAVLFSRQIDRLGSMTIRVVLH